MAQRILSDVQRGPAVTVEVNGEILSCHEGETLATVLLLAENPDFRLVCNMGVCFECMVAVADPEQKTFIRRRACMTPVAAGMRVTTGAGRA